MVAFISAKDVPGENRVKGGASDAPLFAEDRVEYVGQHIGIVVAETPQQAQNAAALVAVRYGHPKVPCLSIMPCQFLSCWMLGTASTTHGRPCSSLMHRGRTVGGNGFCQGIKFADRQCEGRQLFDCAPIRAPVLCKHPPVRVACAPGYFSVRAKDVHPSEALISGQCED